MKNIVRMQNCTLPKNCIAGKQSKEMWKCFLAPEIYNSLDSPVFILNSVYDLYQTQCILTEIFVGINNTVHDCSAIPGWFNCTQQMDLCTPEQISVLSSYKDDMLAQMNSSSRWRKQGNGAFLYSCYSHKAMTYPGNWNFITRDNTTMQQAVTRWWLSENESATLHSYLPCTFHPHKPYNCNPTCWPSIISKI